MAGNALELAARAGSALLALAILAPPATGQAVEDAYGDDYRDGGYGRVRYEEGGAAILRAETERADAERVEAGVNTPIFPGDTALTDPRQRLEVQLAQGSLVRLDRASQLTFLALPDPYAEYADHTVLQLAEGALRLSASVAGAEEFRVDTPAASIYLLGDGDLRVEVDSRGRTTVDSWRGVAEVAASGGSVILRGGMRTEVHVGTAPGDPVAFNTFAGDEFDAWVADREAAYRHVARTVAGSDDAYASLPGEVRPYYVELSEHGSWVLSDDYGWVWTPDPEPGYAWRPYHLGYWYHGPGGYFWVSTEPWGWAPYHYGRWAWASGYGWAWVPGSVFAGAWVSWSWGPTYVGWSALDPWGYPVLYSRAHWGWYDPHVWVFVDYDYFDYRHHHHGCHGHGYQHHYRDVDHVGSEVRGNAVVTRPPQASPADLRASADTRQRALRDARGGRALRLEDRAVATRDTSRRFDRVEDQLTRSGARAGAAKLDPTRGALAARTTGGAGGRAAVSRSASTPVAPRTAAAVPSRTAPATSRDLRRSASGPVAPRGATVRSSDGGSERPAVSQSPRTLAPIPSRVRPESRTQTGSPAAPARPGTPQTQPRPSDSSQRLRELYRSVAGPRQTHESPAAAAPRGSSPPPAPAARPSTAPRPAPRPSTARPATPPPQPRQPSAAPPTRRSQATPPPRTVAPPPTPRPSSRPSAAAPTPSGQASPPPRAAAPWPTPRPSSRPSAAAPTPGGQASPLPRAAAPWPTPRPSSRPSAAAPTPGGQASPLPRAAAPRPTPRPSSRPSAAPAPRSSGAPSHARPSSARGASPRGRPASDTRGSGRGGR